MRHNDMQRSRSSNPATSPQLFVRERRPPPVDAVHSESRQDVAGLSCRIPVAGWYASSDSAAESAPSTPPSTIGAAGAASSSLPIRPATSTQDDDDDDDDDDGDDDGDDADGDGGEDRARATSVEPLGAIHKHSFTRE